MAKRVHVAPHKRKGRAVTAYHRLDARARRHLKRSEFGLPGASNKAHAKGKYPMPDAAHARAAKSYASKEEHAGVLSEAQEEKIDAKANRKLYGSKKAPRDRRARYGNHS